MATKDTSGITKDSSARKGASIRANVEAKALEKRYEFIIESMQEDFDQENERVQTAHSEQIAAMQKEYQQKLATAVENANYNRDTQITQLNQQISEGERNYKELQQMFQVELEKKKVEISAAKAETTRIREQAKHKDTGRVLHIADLQDKIAIDVSFRCKKGRVRTYLRRPNVKFEEAIRELCKDIGKSSATVRFFKNDLEILMRGRTLGEVCLSSFLCGCWEH